MKKIISVLLVFLMALTFTIITSVPAFADAATDFEAIRQKFIALQGGLPGLNTSDPEIAAQIAAQNTEANGYWTGMNKASDRTYLWPDLTGGTDSAIYGSIGKLRTMLAAYCTPTSALYSNTTLRADIINAVDWLFTNWYTTTLPTGGAWWTKSIGIPQRMSGIIAVMTPYFTSATKTKITNAINYHAGVFANDAERKNDRGANVSDKMPAFLAIAIMNQNQALATDLKNVMAYQLTYCDGTVSYDGYYEDGSHMYHVNLPYNHAYGVSHLQNMVDMVYLLKDTLWAVDSSKLSNLYDIIYTGNEPLVWKGAGMSMVAGRVIARQGQMDYGPGMQTIFAVARLSVYAPSPHRENFKSMVKRWANEYPAVKTSSNTYTIAQIRGIETDASISFRADLEATYTQNSVNRVIHRAAGWGLGIAMSSYRVQNYGLENDEAGSAWYTADGMTYLFNNDVDQYSGNFWATVNKLRMPGTTTEIRSRYWTHSQYGDGEGTPSNIWAGSAALGKYGVAGMNLIPVPSQTGGNLNMYKSWFMFDNEVVCLGAKINSSSGYTVETVVDNRKLNSSGNNALTVNGTTKSSSIGWSENMTGVNWIHLAGTASGASTGYYFPQSAAVSGLRQARTDSWYSINHNVAQTPTYTDNYMTLTLNHGVNPTNGSYSYVLLPNMTASQISSYASNPNIVILENSYQASAVMEKTLNVTGVNFWENAWKKVAGISSNKMAAVMMQEVPGTSVEISVADPTQQNTGTITIVLDRPASGTVYADPGVTVTQLYPNIVLTVNVNGSKGKSFKAKFNTNVMNYATGARVSHSSTYNGSGWSPQAVADGQTESYPPAMGWTSNNSLTANHTEWVTLDLGSSKNFNQVNLWPRNDSSNVGNFFPLDFTIQVSTDNTNWTTVVTETAYPKPDNMVQQFAFNTVSARYVKVTGTNLRPVGSEYRMQFAEIGIWNRANYAAGRNVTFSSTYTGSGWSAAAAVDGMRNSVTPSMGWTSNNSLTANHTEWITVDMGASRTVSKVDLYPRNDGSNTGNFFPIDFTIQVSPDNTNWTTVITRTGYAKPGNEAQQFSFTNQSARYVKITGTNLRYAESSYRMQFAEIEIY